jgi:hypothetical protein
MVLDKQPDHATTSKKTKNDLIPILLIIAFFGALGVAISQDQTETKTTEGNLSNSQQALDAKKLEEQEKRRIEALVAEAAKTMEKARANNVVFKSIDTASADQIYQLVRKCESDTRDLVDKKNNPYRAHTPHYSPDQLRKFANLGITGFFPSSHLDDYEFNIIDWNTKQLKQEYVHWKKIEVVIEGAHDGFSPRQYAAVYSCKLNGLELEPPKRELMHYVN